MAVENGILWFKSVCGNSSLEDAFWNPDVTINTDNPDFTECFQDTALVWGACGLLWLAALIYIPLLFTRPNLHSLRTTSLLNVTKLICNTIIIATSVADMVHLGLDQKSYTLSKWLAPASYIVTMILASYTSRKEFIKGENSSGLMFCFWLILLLINSIKLRTNIMQLINEDQYDQFLFSTFIILYTVILFEFVVHLFPDNRALKSDSGNSSGSQDGERTPLLGSSNHQEQIQNPAATKIECPEKYASFLNRMFYVWCSKLLIYGYKRQLNTDKLWELREPDKAGFNVKSFYENWLRSSSNISAATPVIENYETETVIGAVPDDYTGLPRRPSEPSLKMTWQTQASVSWALVRTYGVHFSLIGIYEVMNIILTYIRPVLLDYLIEFVSSKEEYVWKGYFYASMLFVITILRAIVSQLHFTAKLVIGQRARSSLSGAAYRKTLLLSNSARRQYSVGEIINLMAVDAQRVSDATFFIHNLWSAPVNVAVSMYMLYGYLGPSSFAGLAVLLIVFGGNFLLVSKVKKIQLLLMKLKDARTKLINEVLSGIKVIKLYAWERPFQEKISGIRKNEINMVKTVAFYMSTTIVGFTCAPVLFTVVAFSVYILTSADGILSAQVAFVSLTLVNSLSRPLVFLPNGIASAIQAFVSINRLEKFLNQPELDHNIMDKGVPDGNVLSMSDGTFSWDTGETTVLKDIKLTVKDGSLTAVVGQVGCGKSSLLSAILGELHKVTGKLKRVGSIAYVPQEAWVRNQTLRANVLFSKDFDERKYRRSLEACALVSDLDILPAGDMTEIGEKGINLSGGQKQRVSLARAVYRDSDVYLMDDPLSAVDSHVGKHIFDQVIGPDGLLKYKTRILVTHGIAHLAKMDQIIVMKDGRISECGTYDSLIKEDGPFAEFIRTYLSSQEEENEDDEELNAFKKELKTQLSRLSSKDESELPVEKMDTPLTRLKSVDAKEGPIRRMSMESKGNKSDKKTEKVSTRGKRLIEDEMAQIGGVEWSTLWAYLKTMSYAGIVVLVTYFFGTACELGSNIWLSEWSQDIDKLNISANETLDQNLVDLRLGVYAALGIGSGVLISLQTVSTAIACYNASLVIHERLLNRIVRAPMSFFDTTPVGRILNRFSQDMVTVDSAVRITAIQLLRGIGTIITTIIAISFSAPIFLVAILPLTVVYHFLQRFYVLSSNQLRRLVSVLTSPIYSHFGETITGASSIRAYNLQELFIKDCDRRIDDMMESRFAAIIINRWLSIWLEALSGLIVLFTALFAVISRDSISVGVVGLSISYALQITDRLGIFVRNAADLENNVVAVERIHEYSLVEQEAPWHIEGNKPKPEWPEKGQIVVNNYSTRYRPGLELVIKDINCDINGGEKIGIVGRTGAGKSSMTLSLFRIIEATEGEIAIDNVITNKIGLHDLRTKLTIIPQDPVLFSGTLRFNLDPFDAKADDEIYDALELAHLKAFVLTLPEKLDFDCAEGGSNISVGQRQLVCLARALLRKTKVLVLDEATAAVDLETDELIQNTIRTQFKDCTVITIAHRINTVLDYDRIMVMKMGKIIEYDSPSNLMNNKDSDFYSMCKDAGLS